MQVFAVYFLWLRSITQNRRQVFYKNVQKISKNS